MKRIIRAIAGIALLAGGCSSGRSRVELPPEDALVNRPVPPALSDLHTSRSLEGIAPGTFATYRVVRDLGELRVTLGVAASAPEGIWVEVTEDGDPAKVSLRLISAEGRVLKAKYREFPLKDKPSEVVEQPLTPGVDPAPRGPPAETKIDRIKLTVGERSIDGVDIRSTYRDESLGREFEIGEAWSADVPALYEGSDAGGLVKRTAPGVSIELLEWGADYKPRLKP